MDVDKIANAVELKDQKSYEMINGSEAVIRCLLEEEIEVIYGYPGGAIMPIYDALFSFTDKINHVLVRHEQGASHAAEGWARIKNKATVCFATSGPGATNLITGIADAIMDSCPMVCITGQVPRHLLGTDAFQETDVIGITMPVTKWSYQITRAAEIPEVLAKAFFIANSGKPGPVLIDITKNAQIEMAEWKGYKKCTSLRGYHPLPSIDSVSVQKAAELINQAKRPFIIAGHGVLISGAEKALKDVAEKSSIPVCTTLQGLGSFSPEHPLYVGIPGMHGNYGPNILTNECDVLFAIGMRFDDRITGDITRYAKQAKIIHLEIDPCEINKVVKTDIGILGDAKEGLEALLPLLKENQHPEWLQKFRDCDKIEFEKVIKNELNPQTEHLRMGELMNLINIKTKGEAIIVPDVGQHQMFAMRYYNYNKPNSIVTSGGLGTMGFALPASIGAQMAAPERTVVAIIGDGCFQMTLQELGTIWQQNLPVKIVIFNNNFLGMVRQWQQLFFSNRYSQVELQNPNFIDITKGFGIPAEKIEKREDVNDALDRMFAHNGPYLLEFVVEKEANVFPMVPGGAAVSEIILSPAEK
ncbi:MAG: biosynthetic-type acetolactate synthase large subunit [Chitinophagales bacterium]|nr:biosynthetic-type acetolactate synthase large subunit [Chitinophagales bacterium]MCZ2393996.1 biosynthetic-type acetolactate synthase large subunit [Chitinophagales bacterium]